MSHWEARAAFDPTENYAWWIETAPEDVTCCWCGTAIEETQEVWVASAFYPHDHDFDIVPGDWDESLVYAHFNPEVCSTVNTLSSVTVRTWSERPY